MTTLIPPCDRLPWDSEFWGADIARVRADVLSEESLAAIDAWARSEGVQCLYLLASADAPDTWRLAENVGFRLVDIRLELERPAVALDSCPATRPARADDVDALVSIARVSHGNTRFYADPRFPDARCDEFYATWIRKSVLHDFADEVIVVEQNGSPVGYVTCHARLDASEGSIGLIAVDRDARGKRLGLALTQAAVDWCHAKGFERTTVVTQGRNVVAQRTFQRAGFCTASTRVWFHRWQGDAP